MIAKFKPYFKYFFYASSIIVSRGLEYIVLFYAAFYLTKDSYGELEFHKKIIELLAVGLAFGLPSLLLTYTKSDNSKVYLNLLGVLFVLMLSVLITPVFWILDYEFLIIPILFHAIFFNNGIIPVFFLTKYGSNLASIYKTTTSVLFYIGILAILIWHPNPEKAFIIINYYLIGLGLVFCSSVFSKYRIGIKIFKKYWRLFKKLILSSLTLVVSNFANIMFLYTDIMIIKSISQTPNMDIADYSFALNIANMLVLIPMTFVQVDIEKIKKGLSIKQLDQKIIKLIFLMALGVGLGYYVMINTIYIDFKDTLYLFVIILIAKIFQSMSVIHGALILVNKKFGINLRINLTVLLLNLILSIVLFKSFHVFGIAFASVLSLCTRFILLKQQSGYKS